MASPSDKSRPISKFLIPAPCVPFCPLNSPKGTLFVIFFLPPESTLFVTMDFHHNSIFFLPPKSPEGDPFQIDNGFLLISTFSYCQIAFRTFLPPKSPMGDPFLCDKIFHSHYHILISTLFRDFNIFFSHI